MNLLFPEEEIKLEPLLSYLVVPEETQSDKALPYSLPIHTEGRSFEKYISQSFLFCSSPV